MGLFVCSQTYQEQSHYNYLMFEVLKIVFNMHAGWKLKLSRRRCMSKNSLTRQLPPWMYFVSKLKLKSYLEFCNSCVRNYEDLAKFAMLLTYLIVSYQAVCLDFHWEMARYMGTLGSRYHLGVLQSRNCKSLEGNCGPCNFEASCHPFFSLGSKDISVHYNTVLESYADLYCCSLLIAGWIYGTSIQCPLSAPGWAVQIYAYGVSQGGLAEGLEPKTVL